MPGIEKAIHAEIQKALRRHPGLSRLEKQVSSLAKMVKQQSRTLSKTRTTSAGREAAINPKGWRADAVRATRHHLGLSQGSMAKLLGASLNSVSGWENGRAEPRLTTKEKILSLRKLSGRQVANALQKAGLTAGSTKPGRKSSSAAKATPRTTKRSTQAKVRKASAKPARRRSTRRTSTAT